MRHPQLLLLIAVGLLITVIAGQALSASSIETDASAAIAIDSTLPSVVQPTAATIIQQLQDRLRRDPNDVRAYAQLGWAFLLRVRETADASLYVMAEQAFEAALDRDPNQIDAATGLGSLALSRHHFYQALEWGQKAMAIDPYRAQVHGILGDAQTELGDYEAALSSIQRMVDTRPDVASYSRVSYQRELHGDVTGAIEAMERAVKAGQPQAEGTLWAQVQLGNLHFNQGDLDRAAETYRTALNIRSDYVHARAGLARVLAARGQIDQAIASYESIVGDLPLPEFVIALGDLYQVAGQTDQARRQYELVGAIQQLQAGAGVDVDLELALFNLDHGIDLAQALGQARGAYARRPSIYAADVLAWALYQNRRYTEARRYSDEALRLGTRDALLHYHAGLIAYALNDLDEVRRQMEQALHINPYFSMRFAPQARALLDRLSRD